MSTERPPLFDTSSLLPFGEKADIITAYEAARAKDAELIQMLVDALQYLGDIGVWYPEQAAALGKAAAAGFKPTEQ